MIQIPTIAHIQQAGYDSMLAARRLMIPYPLGSVERISFNVGCIVAAFPKLQ